MNAAILWNAFICIEEHKVDIIQQHTVGSGYLVVIPTYIH